ncbi:MAG: methyltransferase domain-containing protein [Betaproteobacteria bacterium]|nr:methyltransferase domain-containing protein [Betaproteobacteria bacterium]
MTIAFITGSGRSGTTSLLRALGLSNDVRVALEPEPTLNIESRELYEGRLRDPHSVLARDVLPRAARALDDGKIYVEKHLSLVPFVPHLAQLLDCKFVIPVRDGRDVVASMLNWHNQMYPIIYQECQEVVALGEHARSVLARQQGFDPFDYSLPRPLRNDPWHAGWKHLSRFEMVSWYWAFVNRYLFDQLHKLPAERYLVVDYTRPCVESIRRVYEFVGLSDFDEAAVARLLAGRVNSLEDRIGETGAFPRWPQWTEELRQRFRDIAYDTMKLLGFADAETRPQPPGFGDWWKEGASVDPEWYAGIYRYRAGSHEAFKEWAKRVASSVGPLESVVDVGSGTGYGYSDFFQSAEFTGIGLSPQAVAWSEERNRNPRHRYVCADIISDPQDIRADMVFSQGTIDNVYDMDAFLRAMGRMANKVLYVANYRGYFNGMVDHRYLWDPKMRVCFNDISARRAIQVLREEGFATVVAFPSATCREDIRAETVIVASREPADPAVLMAGHELYFDYRPYRVQPSGSALQAVLDQVNHGCAYFSESGLDLANPLSYFRQCIVDLRQMPLRRPGTMHALATGTPGVNTAIRVDVDMDLVAGREMARIAAEEDVALTFYLLHTAPYYGYMLDGVFHRNDANAAVYREMQERGAELGLHVDPLGLYFEHGVDGAAAVREELTWLRNEGLDVCGTSPHNCAPVYGAENFEVFRGRSIGGRTFHIRDGSYVPLQSLDESELGLEYEASGATATTQFDPAVREAYLRGLPGGDFLRDERWFRTYILDNPYCNWGFDFNVWLLGKDLWAVAGHDSDGQAVFRFGVSWVDVRGFLAGRAARERVALTLHPIYLGQRRMAGEPPTT